MALMDAKPPTIEDEQRIRRRRKIIVAIAVVAVAAFLVWWNLRFYPEVQAVNHFFQRIEAGDLEGAYGLWMADPNWKQHPEKYSRYNFGEFSLDWGPSGEYGAIHSHKITGASNPPCLGSTGTCSGSGVVVSVEINGRPGTIEKLWVEKDSKSLSFPP